MYGSGGWRGEDSGKVIAEAGMILRDPSALHLIIQQVSQLSTASSIASLVAAPAASTVHAGSCNSASPVAAAWSSHQLLQ